MIKSKVGLIFLKIGIGIAVAAGTCTGLYFVSKAVIKAKNQPTDPSVVVNNVIVTPNTARLRVGASITLEASVRGVNNPPTTVKWTTEDSTICKVDDEGYVTAYKVGTTNVIATSTYDKTKKGSCLVTVVDKSAEPDENEIIEILNDDEYISYGHTPTGDNADREVENEKTKPLALKESYLETFDDIANSRLTIATVEEHAKYTIIDGTDSRSIDGSKALLLESDGTYAGIKFGGMKFTDNASYKISFDYRIIEQSNDFFIHFRSYKAGYDYDVYSPFNAEENVVTHFEDYFDLGNFVDYRLSFFPRELPGKVVIDNLLITRIYSRPRLACGDIANDSFLKVGDVAKFNYKFEDPNQMFEEESTSFYWFSCMSENGLNMDLISKNTSSIALTSEQDNRFIGVGYETSSTMSEISEWTANGRQKNSIPDETISSRTVGGLMPSISTNHTFEEAVPLLEDFEDYDSFSSNISYTSTYRKALVYTQSDYVIDGNKSLYVLSSGYYDGIKTSGYNIKPNTKYVVEFDYQFLKKPSAFYAQFRSGASNEYDVYHPLDMSSVIEGITYHYKGEFNVYNHDDYYLQLFGNNDEYEGIFDNLSITEYTKEYHEEEPTTKPDALVNIGDYALETFGDPGNPVLTYDNNLVVYNYDTNSYNLKYEVTGTQEIYLPFKINYLTAGVFDVEFDYYVNEPGSGYFYLELWCNGQQSDNSYLHVTDMTLDTKLHAKFTANFAGKEITTAFIKIHSYQATGKYEFYLDNIKLIKQGDPKYVEPLVLSSTDGGKFGYAFSTELDSLAYNFKSNGTKQYEKLYLMGKEAISAGTYELSFDYAFKEYHTNEMWITVYEKTTGREAYTGRLSNSGLNTKYNDKISFTLDHELEVIRIMTSNVTGVVDLYINHFELTKVNVEPTVKPENINTPGSYALETFGDFSNKVLAYTNPQFDKTANSFVQRIDIGVGQEIFIDFNKTYTNGGNYCLEFDYYVENPGSGFFYAELWCNGLQSDNAFTKVENMQTGVKLHAAINGDFSGKSITKNFLKFHTYQATAETVIFIDNVKLTRTEDIYCSDPAGGKCTYQNNQILGQHAYNLVSSGVEQYEKFYFKTLNNSPVAAGSYTLSFDYSFAAFTTNTMYITIFDASSEVTTTNSFDVTLNTKHSFSLNFTSTSKLTLIRFMTANEGVIDMSICNMRITAQ